MPAFQSCDALRRNEKNEFILDNVRLVGGAIGANIDDVVANSVQHTEHVTNKQNTYEQVTTTNNRKQTLEPD